MGQTGETALRLANTVIAGVNKAGTTSLFVSLSAHPQVAPSAVKETGFFMPLRYGRELPPLSEYASYFAGAHDEPIRLEATPAYFYGGRRLATCIDEQLPDARILLSFREPVSRLVSFFTSQKARLRLPQNMLVEDYVAACEQRSADDFADPDNTPYFGLRGGEYAEYLPAWLETFGSRLRVCFFSDLVRDPTGVAREIALWLGIDPDALPQSPDDAENRTVDYRSRRFQKIALSANHALEPWLRRHPRLKRGLRAAYYSFNGKAAGNTLPPRIADYLHDHYSEPNARLAEQLSGLGLRCPPWLDAPTPAG